MFSRVAVRQFIRSKTKTRLISTTTTDAEAVLTALAARGAVGLHLNKQLKEDVMVRAFPLQNRLFGADTGNGRPNWAGT